MPEGLPAACGALAVMGSVPMWTALAQWIPVEGFRPDHLRTEIGQHLRAIDAAFVGQVENAQRVEGAGFGCHGSCSLRRHLRVDDSRSGRDVASLDSVTASDVYTCTALSKVPRTAHAARTTRQARVVLAR